jgi:hypothetical protein
MELLIPAARPKRPTPYAWVPAALLCVPPLVAWALIGLDLSGIWRAIGFSLAMVPPAVQAAVMLVCPAAAALIGVVSVVRRARSGLPSDRRLLALTVAGFLLVAVTASAAWARA